MRTTPHSNRRTFLKAAGVGGVALLAGCVAAPAQEPENGNSDQPTQTPSNQPVELEPPRELEIDSVAADPTGIPPPVDWDEPRHHEIELFTTERIAEVEPGVTFQYMTFNDQIPGPMIRVRRGDTVHFTLENPEDQGMLHNIDFHAVYGPGGAAVHTNVLPGETAEVEFKAMYPGVHIYHCAVPDMDYHISAGMFGAILVEPEDGLPEVDRELYFGQHELYTNGSAGEEGHHSFDMQSMFDEDPTYVLLNAEAYGFTENGKQGPVIVEKGDRIRVFLANGGPNLTSAWHPIGNVWTNLYRDGDLVSAPSRYVETTPVAPGTVAAAEMDTPVPGPIKLVDHALSRVRAKGLLAVIQVEGEEEPDIYNPNP